MAAIGLELPTRRLCVRVWAPWWFWRGKWSHRDTASRREVPNLFIGVGPLAAVDVARSLARQSTAFGPKTVPNDYSTNRGAKISGRLWRPHRKSIQRAPGNLKSAPGIGYLEEIGLRIGFAEERAVGSGKRHKFTASFIDFLRLHIAHTNSFLSRW